MEDAAPRFSPNFTAGIGSVHEGRSNRQPYVNEGSEEGSSSSADYLTTPASSHRARTDHGHRTRYGSHTQTCVELTVG